MTIRKWLGSTQNWTTAADWTGGVTPGPSDDVFIQQGVPEVTAAIAVHSITDSSGLSFVNAGGSSVAGNFAVGGYLYFDFTAGAGGSSLSTSGTLSVAAAGQAYLGNATSGGYTTFGAASLLIHGGLTLNAAASEATYLNVQSAAGFGTAGVVTGAVALYGASVIRFASGAITRLSVGSSLLIDGAEAFVADSGATSSNSALTTFSTIGPRAQLGLRLGASISTNQAVYNYGSLNVDVNSMDGGSSFTTTAILYNLGALDIGDASLQSRALVQAAGLRNRGSITLSGDGANKAILNITTGATYLGALTGTITLNGPSLIEVASGEYTSIGDNSSLTLNGATAFVADASATSSNSALTGLLSNSGTLTLSSGAALTVTSAFVNNGDIALGNEDDNVGATLTFKSALTNTGALFLETGESGPQNNYIYTTNIVNSGSIDFGDPFGVHYGHATLRVYGAAGFGVSGTLTGDVYLETGGSIIFNSGAIYDIKANGALDIAGGAVQISGSPSGQSALTSLRQVEGYFELQNDSSVSTSAAFNNSGQVVLFTGGSFTTASTYTNSGSTTIGLSDDDFESSTLTATAFRNSGALVIDGGDDSFYEQSMIVHSAAGTGTPGILTGKVSLSGYALLQFDSGAITTIEGSLSLESSNAFVALKGATNINSALSSLRTVSGHLSLQDDATLSLSGNLAVGGSGEIDVDAAGGGSSLTVPSSLDNEGTFDIGGAGLTASATVTTSTLINNGALTLVGSATAQALLSVNTAAGFGSGAIVTGQVTVRGDAAIVFASGALTRVQSNASLTIDGANAFVGTAAHPSFNTALNGLRTIDGQLNLRNGTVVEPSSSLTVSEYGLLDIDDVGAGGTIVSMGGALDNEGAIVLGNSTMTSSNDLATTRLTNNGDLSLVGSASIAELYVGSAAGFGVTGELTGHVSLTGAALILFASGGLNRIDSGASLALTGAGARVANTSSSSTNSALTTLSAVDGYLTLNDDVVASVSAAALTNNGVINVDQTGSGSQLNVKIFDNYNSFALGAAGLDQTSTLTATSLDNEGVMTVTGHGAALAAVNVSGGTTNDGTIYFASDTQDFANTVVGAGKIYMYSGTRLEFDASVAGAQTLLFGGPDTLVLGSASTFAASVTGFVASDDIDLLGYSAGSTLAYSGDTNSGVLTVTSGANVAHLHLNGALTLSSFAQTSDGQGGLLLSHT